VADETRGRRVHERWATFRFTVVGQLLSSPPAKGELKAALRALSERTWKHPISGEPVRFGTSTIERWFYKCAKVRDPVGVLRRKLRADAGRQPTISAALRRAILEQYAAHKSWSTQLHYDNLVALAEAQSALMPVPSYATLRRFFKANGLEKRRRITRQTEGTARAEARRHEREMRSYEVEHVSGLWHWDGHVGSRKVLTQSGEWVTPVMLGVLDDRSRLACHVQWYLGETAETVAHVLCQAFQKRGLPRSGMSDNGGAMIAAETDGGLRDLSILPQRTLEYTPEANGKQESFWGRVEGRLLAMLENVPDLTLDFLNDATQAWVEHEYNDSLHSEIGTTPISRFLAGPDVSRPCPDSATLKLAFTRKVVRTQRKSDGTITIEGRRFEVPSRYRHLDRIEVRYAQWDLGTVHLVDERTGNVLTRVYPLDKAANASGVRRMVEEPPPWFVDPPKGARIPPLLQRLLDRQAATGLPPAYLPKHDDSDEEAGS
jgi:putative transposase